MSSRWQPRISEDCAFLGSQLMYILPFCCTLYCVKDEKPSKTTDGPWRSTCTSASVTWWGTFFPTSEVNILLVVAVLITQSRLTLLWPHGLYPARLFYPFSRPEYWSGLPFPPGDLPNPGIEPWSPALQENSLPSELPGKPQHLAAST